MYGDVPPDGLAVAVPVGEEQLDCVELTVAVIPPKFVIVTVCEVEQPLASTTDTE